jgi:hypothetical protein
LSETSIDRTASLIEQVLDVLRRYVVLQGDHFYDAVALWVLHSHAVRAAETTPRLLLQSPEKESGKTRALEVLELLVPNPLFVMNTSVAAIFRLLADPRPTSILLDEADAIWSPKAAGQHEDLRALLNAGYRRGGDVARVVGEGKKMTVKRFPVFAATALAAIGSVPDTLESRSIRIPMRRRAPDESVASFRRRHAELDLGPLRDELAAWAVDAMPSLQEAAPEMPDGLTDRAADCWEPLLAIADLAGDEWRDRARDAAIEVVAGRIAEDQSLGVRLLNAVRAVFNGHDRISSAELIAALNAQEEADWGGWHDGKGLNQRDLAGKLRVYGIAPKVTRMPDGSTPRAYERAQFTDAFSRYLRDTSATSATQRNGPPYSGNGSVAHVEEEKRREREAPQQRLPLFAETGSTSATSATSSSNPVAERCGGDPEEEYLAAVVAGADSEAAEFEAEEALA